MHRPQWWDSAQAEEVTKVYQTANAWKDVDPEAVRAGQRIVEEVRDRFGVDLTRDSDPAAGSEAVTRAELDRAGAQEERASARAETAQAVGLMTGAAAAAHRAETTADQEVKAEAWHDTDDQAHMESDPFSEPADWYEREPAAEARASAPHMVTVGELHKDGRAAYDSAERRQVMAEGLDHLGNEAAVDARVRSDVAQGRPARDATAGAPGRAPKARKTRGSGQPSRTVQRTGRSR